MRAKNNSFNLIGVLSLIWLSIVLAAEKVVSLVELAYSKYPRLTTIILALVWLAAVGVVGKSDMEAEIAYYGK